MISLHLNESASGESFTDVIFLQSTPGHKYLDGYTFFVRQSLSITFNLRPDQSNNLVDTRLKCQVSASI